MTPAQCNLPGVWPSTREVDDVPQATCSIDGCQRPVLVKSRGWCSMHYQRWQRNGDPTALVYRERGTGNITPDGYLLIKAEGHPLARTRGVCYEHRVVLYEHIGPGTHECQWCSIPVSWIPAEGEQALVVDHLDENKLNNDPANLVPSCFPCNSNRAKRSPNGKGTPDPGWFARHLAEAKRGAAA